MVNKIVDKNDPKYVIALQFLNHILYDKTNNYHISLTKLTTKVYLFTCACECGGDA